MNFKHVSQKFQMFSDLAIKSNLGLFDKGRQTRRAMEIHKRAGVDSFYDLFLSVPDEEDTILKVLEVLRGISIVNIRINEENREDIHGILQITFKNKGNLEDAAKRLREQTTYKIHLD